MKAGALEVHAIRREFAEQQHRSDAYAQEAAAIRTNLWEQWDRYQAEVARLSQEVAHLKERFSAHAAELQRESSRSIEHLTSQVSRLYMEAKHEAAAYRLLQGEYKAEKASSHELREQLEAANRLVACSSAVGPAAAVEQKYMHKMTVMEFEHEEAMKHESARYRWP